MTDSRDPFERAVAVTGVGAITSLGRGVAENWRRLSGGESGIRRIARFPTEGLRTQIAGCVDFMAVDPVTIPSLSHAMADAAIGEAVGASGVAADGAVDGDLFLAAPPIEHDWESRLGLLNAVDPGGGPYGRGEDGAGASAHTLAWHREFLNGTLADRLAQRYGCTGSPITLTTACASGASAIQLGVESIRRGERTAALCVGTDGSINSESLIRFALLSALSTRNDPPEEAAKPFSRNRDGFVMAEGAAALVLEHPARARDRGAPVLAWIVGCGEAADTFHRTRSNPDGQAIVRSMSGAIADAGLQPQDIGYINAHGTGTPENDKMEYLGIAEVFGAGTERLAVSSNKSMIGHTLTAAGAVEAVATVKSLQEGLLPPTINYREPDPNIALDVVPNAARAQRVEFALSNSFGFGGQNVSLVFAAAA